MAITKLNTQAKGIHNSASISAEGKQTMKKMQDMFIGLVLAVGLLTGSAVADERGASGLASNNQKFALLEGIPAEAMSASEMDQVEGKNWWEWVPHYLVYPGYDETGGIQGSVAGLWSGTDFTFPGGPYPFDQAVGLAEGVFGSGTVNQALYGDPNYWLWMANPQNFYPAWAGNTTSMGACIPGFTVGC
jgi:hypothetical protein